MIYNLLKRIQNLLASKPSGTKEEQEILSLVSQALPAMLNGHDTETLAANELLVRICPDTKRPVLVCHNGNGQCLCLHNGTTEEDAVDVDLWLRSNGRECNGYNKLQEAVVDLAYNAGADNLWEDRDSRAVNAEIVQWAEEFETEHAGTDWGCGGLLPCHRQVLQGKDKTNESGYNTGELKKWQPNGQGNCRRNHPGKPLSVRI